MRSMLAALVLLAVAAWGLRAGDAPAKPVAPPVASPQPIRPIGAGLVPPPLFHREPPRFVPPAAAASPDGHSASPRRLGEIRAASIEAPIAGGMPADFDEERKTRLEPTPRDAATVGRVLAVLQSKTLAGVLRLHLPEDDRERTR